MLNLCIRLIAFVFPKLHKKRSIFLVLHVIYSNFHQFSWKKENKKPHTGFQLKKKKEISPSDLKNSHGCQSKGFPFLLDAIGGVKPEGWNLLEEIRKGVSDEALVCQVAEAVQRRQVAATDGWGDVFCFLFFARKKSSNVARDRGD